jgi:predicted short-subunit dehydrogenase-like oxidoreductase (DUF2520 family)
MAKAKETVSLVGSGNLAHGLAKLLAGAGYEIAEIVTRNRSARARSLARSVGVAVKTIAQARWSGDIVWFAVSDSAIPGLAADLAAVTDWRGKVVLHSSGTLSGRVLLPLKNQGAHVAAAHPMMTFVAGETPEMCDVVWTVEGDAKAVAAARRLVLALGGRPLKINPAQKPLYHAFGAFLSPLLVVHLATASELALKAGIPRRELGPLMKPIIERTLQNLFDNIGQRGGAGKAFSGPLIRGDVETIRAHARSLRQVPAARELYLILVRTALRSDLPVKNRSAIAKLVAGH